MHDTHPTSGQSEKYRVERDDCDELKLSVFLYSWFPPNVKLFLQSSF